LVRRRLSTCRPARAEAAPHQGPQAAHAL